MEKVPVAIKLVKQVKKRVSYLDKKLELVSHHDFKGTLDYFTACIFD